MSFFVRNAVCSLGLLLLSFSIVQPVHAVRFNSGGTGVDGALALGDTECPNNFGDKTTVTIDVGSSGIKQYTTVSIGEHCRVTFTPIGTGSAPVRWIVQGDVLIDGEINLDGEGGTLADESTLSQPPAGRGGPGGYDGGTGAPLAGAPGLPGDGPAGGGGASNLSGGGGFAPSLSDPQQQPLIGGSGGGGCGPASGARHYSGGGGGGGALMIVTSGTITLNGSLSAQGGQLGCRYYGDHGKGGHGMLHLIASEVTGRGGMTNSRYNIIETLNYTGSFTHEGASAPTVVYLRHLSFSLPQSPLLSIQRIAGQTVTAGEALILNAPGDTVEVIVAGTGLGDGTEVVLRALGDADDQFIQRSSETLTISNGLARGNVALVAGRNRIMAYVNAYVVATDESSTSLLRYRGEPITTARLETALGARSLLTFYTASGQTVPAEVVRKRDLRQFVRYTSSH